MASISTTLTLKDKFTNTLNKGAAGVDRMLKSMKALDVQTVKMAPAKLWKTAQATIGKSTEEVNKFIQRQKEAANGAKSVKSAWGGVGGLIKGAIAALGTRTVLGLSDSLTSANARLNLMNDGKQTNDELSAKIMASAQRSRASYLDTASAIAKLGLNAKAAFASNDETIAFMEQVNKLFVIGGASANEQSNAMTQLTQAMAAGALRGEELNSILDAGPGIARAIEKYMGVAEGQIKSVAEQGLVTADVVKNALFDAAETTNKQFESMPKTFAQVWTQISNFAIDKFSGVLKRINAFLNSATGSQIITGIMAGISILAMGINGLFDLIERVGNSIMLAWDTIAPILEVAVPVAISAIVGGLIAWGVTAVQAAIATITAMSPIVLIGLAIGAVIGLIIYAAMKMGATFEDVCGFIGGVFGVLGATIYNVVASAWNYWAQFAEFFVNVWNHPLYSVKKLFVNFANTVLDIVKNLAEALDAVFGSNLADGLTSLQNTMNEWVKEMPEGYKVIDRMERKSLGGAASAGYKTGASIGAGISDTVNNLFGKNGDPFDLGGTFGGAASGGNIPNIGSVGEVGKIKSDINISDEDLKLMKDVAEMRYVQNFVTLTPTVSQHIGTVNQNADVNAIMAEAGRVISEDVAISAAGAYS